MILRMTKILNNKMITDETRIKKLLHDTIDLDGKNESLRLQQKSSMYYIYFAIIVVVLISIFFFKFVISTEQHPLENSVLVLIILLIVYVCWATLFGWSTSLVSSVSNNINYYSS